MDLSSKCRNTFTEFFLTGTYNSEYTSWGSVKLSISEDGDSVEDANGRTLDYLIFANGGFIQTITRDKKVVNSDEPFGYVIGYNDGLGDSTSNKIANLWVNPDTNEHKIEIKALENLGDAGQLLNTNIVNNANSYELTCQTRPITNSEDNSGVNWRYHFLAGAKCYRHGVNGQDETFRNFLHDAEIDADGETGTFAVNLSSKDDFKEWLTS